MGYRIAYSGDRGVRLVQTSSIYLFVGFGMVAAIACGLAAFLMYNAGSKGWQMPAAAALIFGVLPVFIARLRTRSDPQELVFDNLAAFVAIVQRAGATGFIAYQEIDGFDVREEWVGSSGSSSSSRRYNVLFRRRDGIEWQVGTFFSEAPALELLNTLRQWVRLGQVCNGVPETPLPRTFQVSRHGGTVELSWKVRTPLSTLLVLLVFFGGWFTILFQFSRISGNASLFDDPFLVVMFCGGLLVVVLLLGSILIGATRSSRVSVDPQKLVYGFRTSNGKGTDKLELPLQEIEGITLSFSDESGGTSILVQTKEGRETVRRLEQEGLSWENFKAALRNTVRPKIEAGVLSTAEKLNLANFLQRTVETIRDGRPRVGEQGTLQQPFWWRGRPAMAVGTGPMVSNALLGVGLMVLAPLPLFMLVALMSKDVQKLFELSAVSPFLVAATFRQAVAGLGAWRLYGRGQRKIAFALGTVVVLDLALQYPQYSSELLLAIEAAMVFLMVIAGLRLLRVGD